ncbi:unnamed protein product [Microthlaspi erraticum]|uniref:Integrase zinc-binding domain-containing protein n=1 Tax=Microthlaspi erraticum TaxID=1685480 RepID=A0A6D2I8Y0_9BRAS|nr:unnamed protein product [Microthlaspi erraticum]
MPQVLDLAEGCSGFCPNCSSSKLGSPFEIMCDASDYAVGAVLGQKIDKKLNIMLLLGTSLLRKIQNQASQMDLLLQEFVVDKKGVENGVADHLSRMRVEDIVPINDSMPEEQLMAIMKKFFKDVRHYYWDEPYLYKRGPDSIYRRCIAEEDVQGVLEHCHGSAYGGHFATFKTATKVLQAGLWWPTLFKDAASFIAKCDPCQRKGGITKRDEMPLNPILEVEIFDVWGIDFMGPFKPASNGNNYILVLWTMCPNG